MILNIARKLTSSKNTAMSSMRLQPGSFQRQGASSKVLTNSRERRITVSFAAADAPVIVYHGLGFAPSGYTALAIGGAAIIYNDLPLPSTSRTIVLKCNVSNTVADILVR